MIRLPRRTTQQRITTARNHSLLAGRLTHYHLSPVRIALNVLGALCLLAGCVWILQGINILPGSFMTGQTKWAVYGGLVLLAGAGLLLAANRRRA